MFPGPLAHSLAGKALSSGKWSYEVVNIRDYATDKHNTVDDIPYGGGAGMVMRPDVLAKAIDANFKPDNKNKAPWNRLIYMSPRGKIVTQSDINELANCENISIICGRFEGLDERIINKYEILELSVGDFVLSGGEVAATVVMDACVRLLPGVIGNFATLGEESFGGTADYAGLLEYPLYTRPSNWQGMEIPDVLLSGHHAKINEWRLEQAKLITKNRRPDLWERFLAGKGLKD